MSNSKASDILANLETTMYNPSLAMLAVMDTMQTISDGEDFTLVDPGNPLIQLVETSILTGYASIESDEAALRKTYASMATSYEELYPHMCDKDFIDPFAQPVNTTFKLFLGKDEILNKAIPLVTDGIRKLIIPRDSSLNVGGYTFTLQYPIEIRVMPHGGLQVVYDTSTISPIQPIESNLLDWTIVSIPFNNAPVDMLVINVPMMQYKINSYVDNVVAGVKFENSYSFTNQFFTARVFMRSGKYWEEIEITHAERVFDPFKPMAKLTVGDGSLKINIPDLYIRNGLVKGEIRVDIYTTYGSLDVDLMSISSEQIEISYKDISGELDVSYYSPIQTFSYISVAPSDIIKGGRNRLSFSELRDRVTNNSVGSRVVPISNNQLASTVQDMGYSASLAIDYATKRIYHATSGMPTSTISEVTSPIGTVNGVVSTSEQELSNLSTVRINGNRFTILPETLYEIKNGEIKLSNLSVYDYKELGNSNMVSLVNELDLLYTPFHYVLDFNSDIAECRAYYLGTPEVESRTFVETNITVGLDVGSDLYRIETGEYGYKFRLSTRSGKYYKEVDSSKLKCQISFTPRGYVNDIAYLNGTFIGYTDNDEAIFEFYIKTNLDVDRNDDLIVTNFTLYSTEPTPIAMPLDVDMNVIFAVDDYGTNDYVPSNIDRVFRSNSITTKPITHEKFKLNIGSPLPHLWSNVRTITESIRYQRHEENVYRYYEDAVFKRDEKGLRVYTIVDGKVIWEYQHLAGDPVLDANGEHELAYEAGSIKRHSDGTPVIESPATIGRRLDMFLLDARYILSNSDDTVQYRNVINANLIASVTKDIPSIQKQLIDNSEIYLYPKGTMGNVRILDSEGTAQIIPCENSFNVNFYLTAAAKRNNDLLINLRKLTRQAIQECLSYKTISTTMIADAIKSKTGDSIIDVVVEPMIEGKHKILTILDETNSLSIRKKLVLNADNTVSIADNITISYHKHEA